MLEWAEGEPAKAERRVYGPLGTNLSSAIIPLGAEVTNAFRLEDMQNV